MLVRHAARAARVARARRWCVQGEYEGYLSAVDASLGSLEQFQREGEGRKPVVTEKERQAKELVEQIKAMITGIDEVHIKLARVAQFMWMAEDSCIKLPVGVVVDVMHYMMSFSPFPTNAVQFSRPETLLRLQNYLKLHCGVVSDEASRLVLLSLGYDYRPSAFPNALSVLQDLEDSNVSITPRILAAFFIIAKKSENAEHMNSALRKHKELLDTDHFTHNTSYYIHLLNGLSKHGMIEDALNIISNFRNVGFSSILATVCIDVCSRSEDPASAFSMYKVLFSSESKLEPVIEVYSVLLFAIARFEEGMVQKYVNFICTEMARRGVHTDDASFLNRLVISLFAVKSNDQGYELYKSMRARHVELWPVTTEAMPPHLKEQEASPSVLGYNIFDLPPRPVTPKSEPGLTKGTPVFTHEQPRVVKLKRTAKEQRERAEKKRAEEAKREREEAQEVKMDTAPPQIDASEMEGRSPGKGYDVGELLGLK